MDLEQLVRQAASGDVDAFVGLTWRFQHFAFGSALALVQDFQLAEDVAQEAFVAAWSALPSLADPAAFPGWLRGIVRHQAFRVLRRRHFEILPLTGVEEVPSDQLPADDRLDQRQQAAAALAAISELPATLREPATLYYVHECSHQDIAVFLGISAATVNNRLHAARSRLKKKVLTMLTGTLHADSMPDDFANRIGRLLEAQGGVVEALFDPQSLPDLLTELAISDEANRRAVTVQVIQRPGGGIVRGITISQVEALPRGATVLNSRRHTETPVSQEAFELLTAPGSADAEAPKLLETGIKVIDVMCPLLAGGTVAIAGELGAETTVVMEELVRRLSGGTDRVSLFTLTPLWDAEGAPDFSHADALRKDGFSEGTVGAAQTFFFRAEDGPWTKERLASLALADVVIHLSRAVAKAKIYPCVDLRTSRSRLLDRMTVGEEHAEIAERVRQAWNLIWDPALAAGADPVLIERARKLANYFSQPFFCAEPWTHRPGSYVARHESLNTCREILDGRHDDVSVEAFYFAGNIAEIRLSRPLQRVPWEAASVGVALRS
jgi:RNA polymerase sigma factor (sigma-70 family)